jgi:hypothetical protein
MGSHWICLTCVSVQSDRELNFQLLDPFCLPNIKTMYCKIGFERMKYPPIRIRYFNTWLFYSFAIGILEVRDFDWFCIRCDFLKIWSIQDLIFKADIFWPRSKKCRSSSNWTYTLVAHVIKGLPFVKCIFTLYLRNTKFYVSPNLWPTPYSLFIGIIGPLTVLKNII